MKANQRTRVHNIDVPDIVEARYKLSIEGIADDAELVSYSVDTSQLPSGTLYYRVTARGDSDPMNIWQVASNTFREGGNTWFGVFEFELP